MEGSKTLGERLRRYTVGFEYMRESGKSQVLGIFFALFNLLSAFFNVY